MAFTETQVHPDTLLHWLKKQVTLYDTVCVKDMSSSFKDGLALCAIIHRYRPDLVDFPSLQPQNVAANNQLAFDILEREFNIPPVSKTRHLLNNIIFYRSYNILRLEKMWWNHTCQPKIFLRRFRCCCIFYNHSLRYKKALRRTYPSCHQIKINFIFLEKKINLIHTVLHKDTSNACQVRLVTKY